MPKLRSLWEFASYTKGCIREYLAERTEQAGSQIIAFAIIGVLNHPLYHVIWLYADGKTYSNLLLRLSATVLCIPLIFKEHWPKGFQKYLPLYWYVVALYYLPFFFTFMTLKNQGSALWLMNSMSALFYLLLLFDLLSFFILLTVGIATGWLAFYLTSSSFIHDLGSVDLFGLLATFFAAIVIGGIFSHNKALIEREKIRVLSALSATVAHELRTPLRSIQSAVSGLKTYLPSLLESYQAARKAKLSVADIEPFYFKRLENIPQNIEHEARSAFTFIDMLLYKISRTANQSETPLEVCSMIECVEEALQRYPFLEQEETLIQWAPKEDFQFEGNPLMMTHILFNLLKNALYYIEAAGKGEIYIWLEEDEKKNTLHFKDTGPGIPASLLPSIFERFFSRRKHGTGMGLAFCKSAMQEIGGDIQCFSKEGEYTEFILSIPQLKGKDNKG